MKTTLLIILTTFFLTGGPYGLPKYAEKKIERTLDKMWEQEVNTTPVHLKGQLKGTSLEKKNFSLFHINKGSSLVGYLYLSQTPSKFEQIDYMIIFNKDLSVKETEVLIYRESYGGEVGSNRWLRQFEGKKNGKEMEFLQDIQGISGATISCRSLTEAIKQATIDMQKLQQISVI